MWHALFHAIFTGDRNWAWRRRIAIASAATMHVGILNSIFWDHDFAHAGMVMTNCIAGLSAVLTIYVGGAVTDDHLKRREQGPEITP